MYQSLQHILQRRPGAIGSPHNPNYGIHQGLSSRVASRESVAPRKLTRSAYVKSVDQVESSSHTTSPSSTILSTPPCLTRSPLPSHRFSSLQLTSLEQQRKSHVPPRSPVQPRRTENMGFHRGNDGLGYDAHLFHEEELARLPQVSHSSLGGAAGLMK